MNLERILELDKAVLLSLNGSDNMFLDQMALILTSGLTWIPLYLILVYLIVKNNEKWSQIFLILAMMGLCMLISNGFNGGFIKPHIARLRPSVEPILVGVVQLVNGYKAQGFSFFSAHACNTFCIAVFVSLLVRSRILTVLLVFWAMLNAWTRLYLGVHYPSDILVGTVMGILIGTVVYLFFQHLYCKITPKISYVSTQYTRTGYSLPDIDIVLTVFVLIFLYAILRALLELGTIF